MTVGNGKLYVLLPLRLYALEPGTGGGTGKPLDTDNTFNNHAAAYAYGNLYVPHNYEGLACYNPNTLEKLWTCPFVKTQVSGWDLVQVTVGDGLVFCATGSNTDNEVMAVDALTGQRVWDTSVVAAGWLTQKIADPMAYANGVLYVCTPDSRRIWALNAADGTVRWVYAPGTKIFTAPAVSGGKVLVGAHDGTTGAVLSAIGTPEGNGVVAGNLLLLMD